MSRRILSVLSLSLLVSMGAQARPDAPSMRLQLDDYDIQLADYCFPSGLRVIFQEDHSQPIVSITSVIDRGSSDDPEGLEGIAHLVEHMWFKSLHGDLPKVWDVLDEMGAALNASTATDWTNYMTVAPIESMIPLLRLEALRLTDTVAGVTDDDLLSEREVVRNELRMRYENGTGDALYFIRDKLYPEGHPYNRLGIGTHDSLNNITMDDVRDFTANNYTGENTTIVVVGDFSNDDSWQFIAESFPPELLVDPDNPDPEQLELVECPLRVTGAGDPPPEPRDRSITYGKANVEKVTAVMAWTLPPIYRSDSPLLEMTANMMTYAVGTYLNPDWDPLTDSVDDLTGVSCFLWGEELASAAMCFIEMGASDDPERIIERAADGLYQMWDPNNIPWQKYVFSLSRYQQMANVFRSVEVVASIGAGRAAETANFAHFTGDPAYYSRIFEWLNTVDAGASRLLAQEYLNRDRFVAVVVEPYEDEDIRTDSGDALYRGTTREEASAAVMNLDEVDEAYIAGLVVPPDLDSLVEFTMDNGMDVVLMPHGSAPVVQAQILFPGGTLVEPELALDDFTWEFTEAIEAGTEDPLRLAGAWNITGSSTHRESGITGSSGNLNGLLYLLREHLDGLRSDVEDRRNYIKTARKTMNKNRGDPEWWAGYLQGALVMPGHPISRAVDEEVLEAWGGYSTGDVRAWNNTIYQPENATLLVVGRISDVEEARAQIVEYLGDWDGYGNPGPAALEPPAPPDPPDRQVIVFDKPRVSQTDVTLSCQVGPGTMENAEARVVTSAVLDEMAWVALREQSGFTYGAGSWGYDFSGGVAGMQISSLVQNDAAGFTAEFFFGLTERAASGDVDPDMIKVIKMSLARKYVLGHQTTGQMLNRLSSAITMDYGWEYLSGHAERLAAVQVADIQAQMERCTGHEVVTILGPADQVVPQLEARGIAHEVFDHEAERDRLWAENDPDGWEKELKEREKAERREAREERRRARRGETSEED